MLALLPVFDMVRWVERNPLSRIVFVDLTVLCRVVSLSLFCLIFLVFVSAFESLTIDRCMHPFFCLLSTPVCSFFIL